MIDILNVYSQIKQRMQPDSLIYVDLDELTYDFERYRALNQNRIVPRIYVLSSLLKSPRVILE